MKAATAAPHQAEFEAHVTRRERDWSRFWLSFVMMWGLERVPWLVRLTKPLFVWGAWNTTKYMRSSLMINAHRLLGAEASHDACEHLGKRVLSNFYDVICDVGNVSRLNAAGLMGRIGHVDGRERYLRARALKRGAILATAHLGSFETGVAALRQDEPHVHILFRRDPMLRFEKLRAAQRRRLGVIEAPVDDGLAVWVKLRDALLRDEVVLMQADRVMPGQAGQPVPFLGGTLMVPTGPVKLALATGAPIVPIFAPRDRNGKVRIILEEPIFVNGENDQAVSRGQPHPALLKLAGVIERYVRQFPDQWLMVHRALREDQLPVP